MGVKFYFWPLEHIMYKPTNAKEFATVYKKAGKIVINGNGMLKRLSQRKSEAIIKSCGG